MPAIHVVQRSGSGIRICEINVNSHHPVTTIVRRLDMSGTVPGEAVARVGGSDMVAPFSPPAEITVGPATQKTPSGRGKRVLLLLGSVLVVYTLIYVVLRNRGISQMDAYDNVGILYTDVESTFQRKDLTVHLLLAALFAPANELDCQFFGGEYPIRCILFDLG